MKKVCSHPRESRALLYGYDITCGECGKIVGRVALFPCAILDARETGAVLDAIDDTTTSSTLRLAVAKLRHVRGVLEPA